MTEFDIFSEGKLVSGGEDGYNIKVSCNDCHIFDFDSQGDEKMWNSRRDFKKKIKEKQREMYNLVKKKGLSDPEVYSKSCELDFLIVEYMRRYNNTVVSRLFIS